MKDDQTTSDKHTYIHLPNISSRSHSTTFLVPCFVLRWPWTSRLWAGWKPGCGTMLRRRRRLRSSKRGLFKVFSMMVHSFRFSLNAPRHTPLAPDGTSGWAGLQKNRGDVQHEDWSFQGFSIANGSWTLAKVDSLENIPTPNLVDLDVGQVDLACRY